MKIATISNGGPGIITDLPEWDLPIDAITRGNNFRLSNGFITTAGGWGVWYNPAKKYNAGRIYNVAALGKDFFLIGTEEGMYCFDGLNMTAVKTGLAALINVPRMWTFAALGGVTFANHPEVGAFYWETPDPVIKLKRLPFSTALGTFWDDSLGKTARIIRSHKNFLFMLNLRENDGSGFVDYSDSYRWSHPAEINRIPVTWDETDRFFLAGIDQLGSRSGAIIDGLGLRDSFIIYSQNAINILDLSNDVYVWSRRELTTSEGLLATDCVVEVNGKHFMLTGGDIVINDGYELKSIAYGRIRKHLNANISTTGYETSYVLRNDAYNEVWFCVPAYNAEVPNVAYIYNWKEDSWSIKDIPPQTIHACYGSLARPAKRIIDLQNMTPPPRLLEYREIIGSDRTSPFDNSVIGVMENDNIVNLDPGSIFSSNQDWENKQGLHTLIERTNFALEPISQVTTITKVYPKIEGMAEVRITVGSHSYPGAPVRWKPSVKFNPAKERCVNVRTTGELHAFRIESIGSGRFKYSGMEIEYSLAGKR